MTTPNPAIHRMRWLRFLVSALAALCLLAAQPAVAASFPDSPPTDTASETGNWSDALLRFGVELWSDAAIWSDNLLRSTALRPSGASLWSGASLRSDAVLWSDAVVWSDAVLWTDSEVTGD